MRLGPYELLAEIGRGGCGVVWRARAPDGRAVAIKVLHEPSAEKRAAFAREARLLRTLGESEGFVPLLDSGETPGGPYLVMPLLSEGDLRATLDGGALAVPETLALGRALARALAAAHSRGIVHRDLKPANILYTEEGRPLVADAGLAKHFDRSATGGSQSVDVTVKGQLKGTVGYMAPEQMEDAAAVGPPADVFAAGAILHECLAGEPAFTGSSMLDVMTRVLAGTRASLASRRDLPPALVAIVERALARDPAARFADGAALLRALEGLDGAPGRRRRSVLLGGAVALSLAALLLLAATASRPARSAAPPPPAPPPSAPPPPAPVVPSAAERVAPWVALAKELEQKRDLESAIEAAGHAIEIEPSAAVHWSLRGRLRRRAGQMAGARADFEKALELDPRCAEARVGRAIMEHESGDDAAALEDLGRAIEADPRYGPALDTRATIRQSRGDLAGAIADYTASLEIAPKWGPALRNRSRVYTKAGDRAKAYADMKRAAEVDPSEPASWYGLGILESTRGDDGAAFAAYTRAIDLNPRHGQAWANRALIRAAHGERAVALAELRYALALGVPTNEEQGVRRAIAEVEQQPGP